MKSNLGSEVYAKAAKTLFLLCSFQLPRSRCRASNFFQTHIPNNVEWAFSLYECTTTSFNWTPSVWVKYYKTIFEIFKSSIQTAATLHFPDYNLPWVIRCDASDHAVGAVLFQIYTDSTGALHQPIAFASHKFSGAAVNWDTFKQESFDLYYAVVQFNYFLRGKSFVIETDHRNLLWMESSQVPIGFAGEFFSKASSLKSAIFQFTFTYICTLQIIAFMDHFATPTQLATLKVTEPPRQSDKWKSWRESSY